MIRFVLYLIRWQLSTPILAPIIAYFKDSPSVFGTPEDWIAASIANLIGGCIFYWVDRFIFRSKAIEQWEIIKHGSCHDCGETGILRRLVKAPGGYDRTEDDKPQFRCKDCSQKKLETLKKQKRIKF